MSKITAVTVADFRGVCGTVSLDCTDPNSDEPTSIILYGDNGSGKSSFGDAIEFALRGRLSRRSVGGAKKKREVRNLATDRPPGVLIELDDGVLVRRGGGLADSSVNVSYQSQLASGFQYSPIIIRRHDIEEFWSVPEDERQSFFFDYLRTSYTSIVLPQTRSELEAKHQEADERVRAAGRRLATLTELSFERLPRTFRGSRFYLQRVLLPKFGEKRGSRRRLPREMWRAFCDLQDALEDRGRLAGELSAMPEQGPIVDQELTTILQNLTHRVSDDFRSIARLDWIEQVDIVAGDESRLSITLILEGGREVDPTSVLSEAGLDLLALLILLEVHVECVRLGQSPVVILDDVFQSVDTVHRVRTLDHVLGRLRGWQIFLALHDRLWLSLVVKAMQRSNHSHVLREVIPTGFGMTPVVRGAFGDQAAELDTSISSHESAATIAACAGRVLEELCDILSISLETAVTRRRGDRYTLGDLWPGVAKVLKKCGLDPLPARVAEVERYIDLRNLVGAHYNAWARSLATREALDFGKAALDLWNASRCLNCGVFLTKFRSTDGRRELFRWPCKCS